MNGRTVQAILAAALVCSSCQDRGRSAETPPTDEARSLFADPERSQRLSDQPVYRIGFHDSVPLFRVKGAVFFGGGVAIANGGSNQILLTDSTGNVTERLGGRGEGPGEYVNLGGIARLDDGLVTWDQYSIRLTRLDSSGDFVDEIAVSGQTPLWTVGRLLGAFGTQAVLEFVPLGFLGDGPAPPGLVRQEVEYRIVSLSDGGTTLRMSRPGEEEWAARRTGPDGISGGLPVIFGRRNVAAVSNGRLVLADTDSLSLSSIDEEGNTADHVLASNRVPTKPDWVRTVRDSLAANVQAGTRRLAEFRISLLETVPFRPTLPAFSTLLGGGDDRLWIREYADPSKDQVMWIGFNSRFEIEKRLLMPARFRVLDINDHQVLVLSAGEWGEEIIEVYSY